MIENDITMVGVEKSNVTSPSTIKANETKTTSLKSEDKNTKIRGYKNSGNNRSRYRINEGKCKGKSTLMKEHVFQIHAERPPVGHFQDTLDAFKIDTFTLYIKDISTINTLFNDLLPPVITQPIEAKEETLIDPDGV